MRELQLRNTQRERRLNLEQLREITVSLLEELLNKSSYELGIQFVSTRKMTALNQQFLQHQGSTDVITFDYREGYDPTKFSAPNLAGEIYISVADAVAQAAEFGTTWQEEVARYIVHGVLHLLGFDDLVKEKRRVMKREENRLVKKLGRRFSWANIGA